jgi:oxygen-dependent protoporphyrinogen oxidase
MSARVAVVGAGIAGLAAAHRLTALDPAPEVVVLEADGRVGGKVATTAVGGLVLPAGPDSFVGRKPWAVELARELGLELEPPAASSALLWTARGLVAFPADAPFGIPGDVGDVLRWPGVSRRGRLRALGDLVIRRRRGPGDETLGSLLRRRLGDEATEAAVAPLLAGLVAGDVDRLSVRATFPELADWEAWQGSLIRGAQAARRIARRQDPGPMFLRPIGGVHRLAEELAGRLGPRVRTHARVRALVREEGGWRVHVAEADPIAVDAVVLAVPASTARALLEPIARRAAEELAEIRAVSTAVVLMVYAEGTGEALPERSGFVVPAGRAPMLAATLLSRKWPEPAFGTRAVIRCFVGGAGAEEVVDADDASIVEACARHLTALLELPKAPEHAAVVRWSGGMPQYELGHLERVARIRADLPPGLVLVGSSYDGVGIADCVRSASEQTRALAEILRGFRSTERVP